MIITAYTFTKSPREYVDYDGIDGGDPQPNFLLNKMSKPINFNPNDYIDATMVINDTQISGNAIDADFQDIGGIKTDDGTTVWYWRVVNRIRRRKGQWNFTLQADVFLNWDLSSHPIRTAKLNVLNDQTYPLIQQGFAQYPIVQVEQEVLEGSTKGVAVVYATNPLPISGSGVLNQFGIATSPPIFNNMPDAGTRYHTGTQLTETVADTCMECISGRVSGLIQYQDWYWSSGFRIWHNGDNAVAVDSRDTNGRTSFLGNFGAVYGRTNTIQPMRPNTASYQRSENRTGVQIRLATNERGVNGTVAVNLQNLRASGNYGGRGIDTIPQVLLQNQNRFFVKNGQVYRLRLTNVVETFDDIDQVQLTLPTYLWSGITPTFAETVNVLQNVVRRIAGTRSFTRVDYDHIGAAADIYYLNWDNTVGVIPNMAGSSVYAYAFEFQNQLVAESLIAYFYRTYGTVIQDAQWFDNLTMNDINTKSQLATVSLGSSSGPVQFGIWTITDSKTGKTITSSLLTRYLNMSKVDRLYNSIVILAPDGSNLLEVDRNITSDILRLEYDLLPIEGKVYAHFNYTNLDTGVYNSNDTQKMIMWRAGRFSGALSAYVEFTLQNSTFQQITNAGFNQAEQNNRLLDAQQNANLIFQKNQQAIGISQQQANAQMALTAGAITGGLGVLTGNPMALLGGAGLGMKYAQTQMNIEFQKQQNDSINAQTAYNNGVASQLRTNELALAKQVNDLNIQALRDRPNTIVPSSGVSIKRVDGLRVCLFAIPITVQNAIRDVISRFGFDIDMVWTWDKTQNIMGTFMYLPFTPRINEFLQTMLAAGLYRENYLTFGDNIVIQ